MIVVRVELWSARTGEKTELARMEIANDDTGTFARRNYTARTLRGRSAATLNQRVTQREGMLKDWPAQQVHIWNLVAAILARLGYGAKVHA